MTRMYLGEMVREGLRFQICDALKLWVQQELVVDRKTEIIFVGIGSPEVPNDLLGPLVVEKMKQVPGYKNLGIGSVSRPMTFSKKDREGTYAPGWVEQFYKRKRMQGRIGYLVGIDAGMARNKPVGMIYLETGPILPGSGLGYKYPKIGDFRIVGITCKDMEDFYLCPKLELVHFMAEEIASGIMMFHDWFKRYRALQPVYEKAAVMMKRRNTR